MQTLTRDQFNAIKAQQSGSVQSAPKSMTRAEFNAVSQQTKPPVTMTRDQFNAISPTRQYAANVPQWMRSVDTGLRGFSQWAENVPKFTFADNIENPIGKFFAGIPQSLLNTPSDFVQGAFSGYGKDITASDALRRTGQAVNVGLNVATFPGLSSILKAGAEQGMRQLASQAVKPTLGEVIKKSMIQGAGYAGAYGVGSGLQQGDTPSEQLQNAIFQGAVNAPIGAASAGLLTLGGVGLGRLKGRSPRQSETSAPAQIQNSPIEPQSVSQSPVQAPLPETAPTGISRGSYTGGVSENGGGVNPLLQAPNTSSEIRSALTGDNAVKNRGFSQTIQGSKNAPQWLKNVMNGTYIEKHKGQLVSQARSLIQTDPQLAEQLATNPTSDVHVQIGNELLNHYAETGQQAKAQALAETMDNAGTEFGRAVQAFSNYDKTTPGGALKFAMSAINAYNKNNPGKKLTISSEQVQGLFEQAKEIQNMPAGRERNIASHKLMETISDFIPSSFADKAISVWKAGLLTSLRTHERNFLGNTIHGVAEVAKDIPASLADRAMSLSTGKRTLTATAKGFASGWWKGMKTGYDVLKSGYDPEQAIEKFDVKRVTWDKTPIQQALKYYTESVFRTLGATDKPFWNASYARSLYDQAGAEAINAGRSGDTAFIQKLVLNPTEQMLVTATNDANVATFKNPTVLGQIASRIKSEASATRTLGPIRIDGSTGHIFTEVTAPFTNVPSSIFGQTIAYSPIGLMKGIARTGKVLFSQVPDLQRQAAQELGRGVIGSGVYGLGAYLASKGLITGKAPDAETARLREAQGIPDNAIFINGQWRSINSIGPESLVMLAGAKAQEEMAKGADASLGTYAANLGRDQLSQTFLSGVQAPLNALSDPVRYGGQYVKGLVGSAVPNITKDVAKSQDPYVRTQESVMDAIGYGIPGWRNTLSPKRTALGDIVPNDSAGASAYFDLFNSRQPINDPVVNEIARLYESGTKTTFSKPDKKASAYGLSVDLTPQEYDRMQEKTGGIIKPLLEKIINAPEYQNLSDYDRAKMINSIISTVRRMWDMGNMGSLTHSKEQIQQELQQMIKQRTPSTPFFTK